MLHAYVWTTFDVLGTVEIFCTVEIFLETKQDLRKRGPNCTPSILMHNEPTSFWLVFFFTYLCICGCLDSKHETTQMLALPA